MTAGRAIGHIEQIPRGEGRNFALGDRVVAVFRTHADEVFATQAACPHLGGPLADGMLGGTIIVCPLHDRSFDLRTGAVVSGECGIAVYPIWTDAEGRLILGG
jgi:nitrite reductase (NADH) small subunit